MNHMMLSIIWNVQDLDDTIPHESVDITVSCDMDHLIWSKRYGSYDIKNFIAHINIEAFAVKKVHIIHVLKSFKTKIIATCFVNWKSCSFFVAFYLAWASCQGHLLIDLSEIPHRHHTGIYRPETYVFIEVTCHQVFIFLIWGTFELTEWNSWSTSFIHATDISIDIENCHSWSWNDFLASFLTYHMILTDDERCKFHFLYFYISRFDFEWSFNQSVAFISSSKMDKSLT